MQTQKSFCRICFGFCGLDLTLDDDGRIVEIRGDKDHPLSSGYACSKGVNAAELHNDPARVLHPLKRMPDGTFARIGLEQALDEIAARLRESIAAGGANSHALYQGMGGSLNASVRGVFRGWLKYIGSTSFFSSMTIDQSAKWVSAERLGVWGAGATRFDDADVWLVFGHNPMVSVSGALSGFPPYNPARRMKEAKARGTRVIVIDPRQTETARHADVFLQPLPGHDAIIAAGILHLIFAGGHEDRAFCGRYANGVQALRAAVAEFTPERVAACAGIDEGDFRRGVSIFVTARSGGAFTGTGPNMAAHSNLSQHLVDAINVVCGRYPRAGDRVANPGVLSARRPVYAEVIPPGRSFEKGRVSRVRGLGTLFGQMMTGALADEILTPGKDQIRSLFVVGGNLASALPDQNKAIRALSALDLLVCVDPQMNATARLAHYVLPPTLMFERDDLTLAHSERNYFPAPFAQYARAAAAPPAGAELVEDHLLFWGLVRRMGGVLEIDGVPLDMERPPTIDELLALSAQHGQVPYEAIKQRQGGAIFDVGEQRIEPARAEATGRFELLPDDVAAELRAASAESPAHANYPFRLVVRRMREVMNSFGQATASVRRRRPHNPAHMHPDDIAALGLSVGARINIASRYGAVEAFVEPDATLRRGLISLTHGWGGLPGDADTPGIAVNQLTDSDTDIEAVNAMPRFSSLPVSVSPA